MNAMKNPTWKISWYHECHSQGNGMGISELKCQQKLQHGEWEGYICFVDDADDDPCHGEMLEAYPRMTNHHWTSLPVAA